MHEVSKKIAVGTGAMAAGVMLCSAVYASAEAVTAHDRQVPSVERAAKDIGPAGVAASAFFKDFANYGMANISLDESNPGRMIILSPSRKDFLAEYMPAARRHDTAERNRSKEVSIALGVVTVVYAAGGIDILLSREPGQEHSAPEAAQEQVTLASEPLA